MKRYRRDPNVTVDDLRVLLEGAEMSRILAQNPGISYEGVVASRQAHNSSWVSFDEIDDDEPLLVLTDEGRAEAELSDIEMRHAVESLGIPDHLPIEQPVHYYMVTETSGQWGPMGLTPPRRDGRFVSNVHPLVVAQQNGERVLFYHRLDEYELADLALKGMLEL